MFLKLTYFCVYMSKVGANPFSHIQFSWERGGSKIRMNLGCELIKYQSEGSKHCSVCIQRTWRSMVNSTVAHSEVGLEFTLMNRNHQLSSIFVNDQRV